MTRVPAAAVAVLAAMAGLVSVLAPDTQAAYVSYLVTFGVLVALAWTRWRVLRGPARSGYAFVAAALSVWLAGDVLHDVAGRVVGQLPDVTPSDALWIAGYPLLAVGLVRLTRLRAPGRLREGLLDGLAMATVVAWLFWQYLILPAVVHEHLSLTVLFAAFYPFGDVLLFAATAVLVLAPGSKRGPTRYLVAALGLTLAGDVGISTLPELLPGLAGQTDRLDGVLLLANGLLVAAMAHPEADQIADATGAQQRLHPARVVFLGIALLVLPVMAALHSFDSVLSRVSLVCSVVLLTALILVRFVLVLREQDRIRAALAHQVEHDPLTGLANRSALLSRLDAALAHRRDGYGPVVLYLDLNGFKQVNDRHGHAAGDAVLVEFARRLTGCLRPGDLAARLGGDEFVVLATDVADEADARALADRMRDLAAAPVVRGDEQYRIGVSVGLAAAGATAEARTDDLLVAADHAMYAEKPARLTPAGR
ncbi:diguanylate cyclase domain-containing protein [Actinoplanes sp. URMC 104]|uniref:diguanylate cyclase domain-containing protein n=1 Tax=Actinoplanes sp. URMC 104 TaxID=3423409 RepID=UPI003F1C0ECB